MTFAEKLNHYFSSGYSFLSIDTNEELRAIANIKNINNYRKVNPVTIFGWDCINGIKLITDSNIGAHGQIDIPDDTDDPIIFLRTVDDWLLRDEKIIPSRLIFIVKDFHLQLEKSIRSLLLRRVRNMTDLMRSRKFTIIFLSPEFKIPIEIIKEVQKVDFKLPNDEDISLLLNHSLKSNQMSLDKNDVYYQKIIDAAKGLTELEIDNAFSLGLRITKKEIGPLYVDTIFQEKIQILKKDNLLEYIPSIVSFENVGGAGGIKKYIQIQKKIFTSEARSRGIPRPKGSIFCGPPGTGKTLLSKCIAKELGVPLFKLDMGGLFHSHVGQTEANFRRVIEQIEALGPCVILIDEIEKSLNNSAVNGQSDSGTSSRSFGTLLTWLNDRTGPAYIIATSNDHTILPPPLIRPERFDSLFWIDLPGIKERIEILQVVLKKYRAPLEDFNLSTLASMTSQFTGVELDDVVKTALIKSFANDEVLSEEHIVKEISHYKVWAILNKNDLDIMRDKAKNKLRVASDSGDLLDVVVSDGKHNREIEL